MKEYFCFDERLGILVPDLSLEWDYFKTDTQHSILFFWEQIRGSIPDRIADLEKNINHKQSELSNESNFMRSCELNNEIAELASIINDLWIWYRENSDVSTKIEH